MNTLFLTLFRPVKAFNLLKAEQFSAINFVLVLTLMMVNLILLIPVSEKILQITVSTMSMPQNQVDTMLQVAHKMRYLQIAGSGILYLVMFFFYALILYLIVLITREKLNYKKALQLLITCFLIIPIGDLINTVFVYMRGVDNITHLYDMYLTGLNLLISFEQIGTIEYVFLSYINPFQLWFAVLLSIGLKIFTEMKMTKALMIGVVFWLITVLFPVLSVFLSQTAVGSSGLK